MRIILRSTSGLSAQYSDALDFLDHGAVGPGQHQARYSAIVLALYAGLEGAVRSSARVCGEHVAKGIKAFGELPAGLRFVHVRESMAQYDGLLAREPDLATVPGLSAEHAILRPFGDHWWRVSGLFLFTRNIWPDALNEKVRNLGGPREMDVRRTQAHDDALLGSPLETLEWLVQERNQLAHGHIPDSLLEPALLRLYANDLVDVASTFARELSILASKLGGPAALSAIGSVAPDLPLGPNTVGIESLTADVAVGDEVLIQASGGLRLRRVISMQTGGVPLEAAPAGSQEVAITLHNSKLDATALLHLA